MLHEGTLPERFFLIGVARGELSDEDFRSQAAEAIRSYSRRTPDPAVLDALLEGARFVPPESISGRLLRFDAAGLRHRGLTKAVAEVTALLSVDAGQLRSAKGCVPA